MVGWGFSTITDALQKRLCRFLIHRYLSDFLKSSINLEQLSGSLCGGSASVSDVDIDVQKITEAFESAKLPLTAVEGYIGNVTITVPWQDLLMGSVDLSVNQLQLTLQLNDVVDESTGNLVSSMFGSMVGSLATSMEIAQSFLNQEEAESRVEDKGVEQFAEVIDAVISRFRLTFRDAIIRLETSPNPESGLCTALELQIDWIELIDEQLESCNVDTVTSQPHYLSAVPDFNKLFHTKGVRLYTDVFSNPEVKEPMKESISSVSQVITSMYLRRERLKSQKLSVGGLVEENVESSYGNCSSLQSTVYESCYSQKSCADNEMSNLSSYSCLSGKPRLESNPVLLASFAGGMETILVRVRNNEISVQGAVSTEKEVNLAFNNLCVFLTPSQLCILKYFMQKITAPFPTGSCEMGKPMSAEDYHRVEADLQARIISPAAPGVDFQHGNWGGSMMFYDAQRKPTKLGVDGLSNVPLCAKGAQDERSVDNTAFAELATDNSRTVKHIDNTSDVTTIRANISKVLLFLTHDDYLGWEEVRDKATNSMESVAEVIVAFKQISDDVFLNFSNVNLGGMFDEFCASCQNLYQGDHLRFAGDGVSFAYKEAKTNKNSAIRMTLEAVNAKVTEALVPGTTTSEKECSEEMTLFAFRESHPSPAERTYRLSITLSNGVNDKHYDVLVNLDPCESELDISLIDRISSTIVTRPFYTYPLPAAVRRVSDVSLGLKSDFLFNALQDETSLAASTVSLDIKCSEWFATLRIPVTDLRCINDAGLPNRLRNLHKEAVQFTFLDAHIKIPAFDVSRITQYGSVSISSKNIHGCFLMNGEMHTAGLESLFLYAGKSETGSSNDVKIKLTYDKRNTTLKATAAHSVSQDELFNSSFDGECEENSPKLEGPFSKCIVRNENRMVVQVAPTKELFEFGQSCLANSGVTIEVAIPQLRLHFPSRHFYEVLYNRLANDLVMWQPSAPVYRNNDRQHKLDVRSSEIFLPCRPSSYRRNSLGSSSSRSHSHRSSTTVNAHASERAHNFCLMVNVSECRVLLANELFEHGTLKLLNQIGSNLRNVQLCMTSGFHGNEELSFAYITSKTALLYYKDLADDVNPYEKCVLKNDFAEHLEEGVQAEPLMSGELCHLINEDNFSVAMRFDFRTVENCKDVLAAFGIRNTVVNIHHCDDAEKFWVTQLFNFFNVVDYGIPGYELPRVSTELHVNLSSAVLAYEHSQINPGLPLSLRVVLGSCSISSKIMQNLELYRFEGVFEQTKMFASCKKKESDEIHGMKKNPPQYIELLAMGLLQLEISAMKVGCEEKRQFPLLEVKCKNDLLKVWVCADSLAKGINVALELVGIQSEHSSLDGNKSMETNEASESRKTSGFQDEPVIKKKADSVEKLVQSALSKSGRATAAVINTSDDTDIADAMNDIRIAPIARKRSNSGESLSVDEGFCLVNEIPGSGILPSDGLPHGRFLYEDETPPVTYENYLKNLPVSKYLLQSDDIPLVNYVIDDISLEIHLFGGSDFGVSSSKSKPYSTGGAESDADLETHKGGPHRDLSAHVEIRLFKVKFTLERYASDARALSTKLFSIGTVEIVDRVASSKIHKFLYKLTSADVFPRRSVAPMFAIRVIETHPNEGRMRVSLQPLRMNADQDTLEFLEDFWKDVSEFVSVASNVPDADVQAAYPVVEMLQTSTGVDMADNSSSDAARTTKRNRSIESIDHLFDESDPIMPEEPPNLLDTFDCLVQPGVSNTRFAYIPASTALLDDQEPQASSESMPQNGSILFSSEENKGTKESQGTQKLERSPAPNAVEGREEFYVTKFTFAPPTLIRCDIHGKRPRKGQGWFFGLLFAMSDFKCTDIHFKDLEYSRGLLGYERCLKYAVNEWIGDVDNKNLARLFLSYGPLKSFVDVGSGIRDLFLFPIDEYRSEEGHVVKGLQRGAESFGISTASAAVDIIERMVGVVQSVAELAFDIVSPDCPPYRYRRAVTLNTGGRSPNDIRDGFNMAYETVRQEVSHTAEVLQRAAEEDRACGYWALRGFLRHATPTVIRPVVAVSRATIQILGGLRNQMRPDSHREEMVKWKASRKYSSTSPVNVMRRC